MRRSRVQVKPNLGPSITSQEEAKRIPKNNVDPVPSVVVTPPSSVDTEPVESEPSTSNSAVPEQPVTIPKEVTQIDIENSKKQDHVFRSPLPKHADGSALISPRHRLLSTCSTISAINKKEKKKFTGDEELDPKTMRMVDLITWNPKNEKKLDRSKLDDCESRSEMKGEEERPAAPQLKLDSSGKLVVDESSLVIDERSTNSAWQIVQEDRITRKINSSSFRRWRKGTTWTEKETDFFYEVLRSTGPDFGLMHDFFPRRARNELKSKYNREEKMNWKRVHSVLSKPCLLDNSLYERASIMCDELELEEKEKMEAKLNKKKKVIEENKKRKNDIELCYDEEWNEDTADLEAEAIMIINELELMDKKREELANTKKELAKKRAADRKKLSTKAAEIIDESLIAVKKKKEEPKEKKDEKDKKSKCNMGLEGYPDYDNEDI